MGKLERVDLQHYIRDVFNLEASLYAQDQRIHAFYSMGQKRANEFSLEKVPKKESGSAFSSALATTCLDFIFGGLLIFVAMAVVSVVGGIITLFPTGWLNVLTGQVTIIEQFFGPIIELWVNIIGPNLQPILIILLALFILVLFVSVDKETKNRKKTDKEIKKITLENELKQLQLDSFISAANKELNKMQNMRNQTEKILTDYYSLNIIHQKYRGLVSVASICEYLESGSCDTLKEAYNKYDLESRLGIIISKLDTIIEKLDSIANSQHLLYSVIAKTNADVKTMTRYLNSVDTKLDAIAVSNANAEFNGEIAAKNSEMIKSLMFFSSLYR